MGNLLWVMLGGAVGSGARYLVAGSLMKEASTRFPYGTLTVNLVGCLLIGVLATVFAEATGARPELRLVWVVGVLGGFTTFSSFGLETLQLINQGRVASAVLYVLLSTLVGLGLAYAGTRLGAVIAGS
jgi:CrcB protein